MLELYVYVIGLLVLILLSTNDKTNDGTQTKNKLRWKLDNMTTYEIDMYLKDRDLYNEYKDNSREYKINKIIERKGI